MREVLYFTPAEYIVMMELAGGGHYSVLRGSGLEPDDNALVQAFSSLYQRGMILRAGEGFALSDKGSAFPSMKRARWAVLVSAVPAGLAAVCYVAEDGAWVAQLADDILSWRYRLLRLERDEVAAWLAEAAQLEPPVLRDADIAELGEVPRDPAVGPGDSVLLRLERHINGGGLLCSYEVAAGSGGQRVVRRDSQGCSAAIYTQEALERMLEECFGEEAL